MLVTPLSAVVRENQTESRSLCCGGGPRCLSLVLERFAPSRLVYSIFGNKPHFLGQTKQNQGRPVLKLLDPFILAEVADFFDVTKI